MTAVTDSAKLAQAQTRLMDMAFAFVTSQASVSAQDLGLFDALTLVPATVEEIAGRIGIRPVACRRLLMLMVSLDLAERDGDGFRNSETGELCSSRSDVKLGATSRINPFYAMTAHLSDALREYSPRWRQTLGVDAADAFAALYANPVALREFAELMNAISVPQGRLIAERFDFAPCRCIMDVAGGPGGQSIAIGVRHPHLRGIVTDLEPVCVVARENIAASGLTDRFTAVAADLMAGPYPVGADVILLGHILHDWSDDVCGTILRNCAAALPAGGTLLISESVLHDDFSGSTLAHVKDLLMLVANEPGARERSEREYRELLDAAGFDVTNLLRLDAPRDLLVARKR
ncbi:MAG TPA: methyltransferase [Vicinamibacterales bacterium]|nr:methyltransferase [Vicinamibacterales bacterium]